MDGTTAAGRTQAADLTRVLASRTAEFDYDDLPAPARELARQCILDYLGVALARLGHRQRAMLAFETCLSMLPGLVVAHRWLAALHSQPGGDLDKAIRHRSLYAQLMRQRKTRLSA